MRRNARTVLLLLGALAALPSRGTPAEDPFHLKIEPFVFEAESGKVEAEKGTITVPENRRRPGGRTLDLAFVRFRSTSPKPGSPIVYLAGGPGGSGIAAARGSRFPLFQALRGVADVIAFDQRGTGRSQPDMTCKQTRGLPLDRAGNPEEMLAALRAASRACAAALRAQGIDLSAYNSVESAGDLDDLRRALGAEKISLWSISYGTHLAFATLRRHGPHVERVILAGTEGPAHTLKLPRAQQEAPGTLLGDAINFPFPGICPAWEVPDLGEGFRAPLVTAVPALFVSGTLDGRTPVANAEEVGRGFRNGVQLVIEGAGHSDPLFLSSPDIARAMLAFLKGQPIPVRRIQLPPPRFLPPRRLAAVSREVLARYVGVYRIDDQAVRRVILAGDLLYTPRTGRPPVLIRPLSETEFFYEGTPDHLKFVIGSDGKVTQMVMFQGGGEQAAVKIE